MQHVPVMKPKHINAHKATLVLKSMVRRHSAKMGKAAKLKSEMMLIRA